MLKVCKNFHEIFSESCSSLSYIIKSGREHSNKLYIFVQVPLKVIVGRLTELDSSARCILLDRPALIRLLILVHMKKYSIIHSLLNSTIRPVILPVVCCSSKFAYLFCNTSSVSYTNSVSFFETLFSTL